VESIVDVFGNITSADTESAHLMPHSPYCSMMWFSVVSCVLSLQQQQTWHTAQKAIQGFREPNGSRKIKNFGIKHFPTNRILLKGQKTYFDNSPCVMIIPAMGIDEVNRWNGEDYSAIVLLDRVGAKWKARRDDIETIFNRTGATKGGSKGNFLATKNELTLSTNLLKEFVL
jgi:hypothetical protein